MKTVKIIGFSLKWLWRLVILGFVAAVVLLTCLALGRVSIPSFLVDRLASRCLPPSLVLDVGPISFGFRSGLTVECLKLYDRTRKDPLVPLCSFTQAAINPFSRHIVIDDLHMPRLHDGYYEPENNERSSRVEASFPELGRFHLTLRGGDILGVKPERVESEVEVERSRVAFERIRLYWPDSDVRMQLDGDCVIDIDRQRLTGGVNGVARQSHIRPLLVALDLPVSLPYMDGFTEVPEPVKSGCTWDVNLVNSDFDLVLKLDPVLGKYNGVPMRKASGTITIHPYTRGTCLNYHTVVGPIAAVDVKGRPLEGTVDILGTNRYNTVTIDAKSAMPIADLIRVAGFTGNYVGSEAIGNVTGHVQLRFPRSMTNNYEVLNGEGRFRSENGRLNQMRLFAGLTEILADKVPGVSSLVDQTTCSADFTIRDGVVRTDNMLLEGDVFSIRMSGTFDAPRDRLDYAVRVSLFRNETLLSRLTSPFTWTFSKLLMEFRLTGSPSEPEWRYVSVIDRVLEVAK